MVSFLVLAGLHGTGKTTLAGDLQKYLSREGVSVKIVSEVARGLIRENKMDAGQVRTWAKDDVPKFIDFQGKVLMRQDSKEVAAETSNCDLAILDRGVDSIAYAFVHGGNAKASNLINTEEAKRCLKRYQKGLVVFLKSVGPAEDDGVRLLPQHDEAEFLNFYKELLKEHNVPHITLLESDRNDRVTAVRNLLDGNFHVAANNKVCVSTLKLHNTAPTSLPPYFEVYSPTGGTSWGVRRCAVAEGESSSNRFMQKFPNAHNRMCVMHFHPKVPSKDVFEMLQESVYVNGEPYRFLGCTSSGLKQRRCYLYQGTESEIDNLLSKCGNFNKLAKVSTRLARIGLLFSTCSPSVKIDPTVINDIPDIERNGHIFTDGCGLVGRKLAKKIMSKVPPWSDIREKLGVGCPVPSVIQIRFQGYKGVVSIDPDIPDNKIHLRSSLKKFETDTFPVLNVCNYSKPYTIGSLNLQFVRLLSGLGVPDEVFLDRLEEHYSILMEAQTDHTQALVVLSWKGNFNIALSNQTDIFKEAKRIRQKELSAKKQQLRVLLHHSRQLFGIADHRGLLEYGQVFVRVTQDDGPQTIRGKVVVSKCPAYLLGDIRVLQAVSSMDNPALEVLNNLCDCIIYPTKGETPHPHEIAGSDLDGDEYFVCWDKDLIPPRTVQPYSYDGGGRKQVGPTNTPKGRISHFSKQGGGDVGLIDTLYGKWADVKGVASEECSALGKLFSQAIDAAKTGSSVTIPESLRNPPEIEEGGQPFVWTRMLQIAAEKRAKLHEETTRSMHLTDDKILKEFEKEFIEELISTTNINVTEYQKFRFANRWCKVNGVDMHRDLDLCYWIDFGCFTADQLEEAIEEGVPPEVARNALNKSQLLTSALKKKFTLDHQFSPWRLWIRQHYEDLDLRNVLLALTKFSRVLVVMDAGSGILACLQFNKKCKIGITSFRDGQLAAYMHSLTYGDRYVFSTPLPAPKDRPYELELTNDLFQLYERSLRAYGDGTDVSTERRSNENRKGNTFVWMKRVRPTKSSDPSGSKAGGKLGGKAGGKKGKKGGKHQPQEQYDPVTDDRVSIDLGRFFKTNRQQGGVDLPLGHPRITKSQVRFLEIFIQDNDITKGYYDIFQANTNIFVNEEDGDDECDDSEAPFEDWRPHVSELTQSALDGNRSDLTVLSLAQHLDEIFRRFGHADCTEMTDSITTLIEITLTGLVGTNVAASHWLHVLAALSSLQYADVDYVIGKVKESIKVITINELVTIAMEWRWWAYINEPIAIKLLGIFSESSDGSETSDKVLQYLNQKILSQTLSLVLEMNIIPDYDVPFCKLLSLAGDSLTVRLLRQSASLIRVFQPGTSVAIGRSDSKTALFMARIESVDPQTLCIVLRIGDTPLQSLLLQDGWDRRRWGLRTVANITDHERIVQPLKDRIMSAPLIQFLSDDTTDMPHLTNSTKDNLIQSSLNNSQKSAVKSAVSHAVTLIKGPPGTGKTQVLSEIVTNLVESASSQEGKVLVVAQTNIAVDNAVRRLRQHVSVIRVGLEGVSRDLLPYTIDGRLVSESEESGDKIVRKGSDGRQYTDKRMIARVLKNADVVCATISGAGSPILSKFRFPIVVVDEATQCLETSLLPSLVRGCNQLVLIGDTQQLPPMNPLREKSVDSFEGGLRDIAEQLPLSLFHRLNDGGRVRSTFLEIQHRMHPAISSFVSKEFYGRKLKDGVTAAERTPSRGFPWPAPSHPVCYCDVQGTEENSGTSRQNKAEAKQTAEVVKRLLRAEDVDSSDICVLTPYKGQVECIQRAIQGIVGTTCDVCTVDSFQGKEAEYIVFSTVRTANLGFAADPKRINVLLTRCKRGLIGVCDAATLRRESDIWRRWIGQAKRCNLIGR